VELGRRLGEQLPGVVEEALGPDTPAGEITIAN